MLRRTFLRALVGATIGASAGMGLALPARRFSILDLDWTHPPLTEESLQRAFEDSQAEELQPSVEWRSAMEIEVEAHERAVAADYEAWCRRFEQGVVESYDAGRRRASLYEGAFLLPNRSR